MPGPNTQLSNDGDPRVNFLVRNLAVASQALDAGEEDVCKGLVVVSVIVNVLTSLVFQTGRYTLPMLVVLPIPRGELHRSPPLSLSFLPPCLYLLLVIGGGDHLVVFMCRGRSIQTTNSLRRYNRKYITNRTVERDLWSFPVKRANTQF